MRSLYRQTNGEQEPGTSPKTGGKIQGTSGTRGFSVQMTCERQPPQPPPTQSLRQFPRLARQRQANRQQQHAETSQQQPGTSRCRTAKIWVWLKTKELGLCCENSMSASENSMFRHAPDASKVPTPGTPWLSPSCCSGRPAVWLCLFQGSPNQMASLPSLSLQPPPPQKKKNAKKWRVSLFFSL